MTERRPAAAVTVITRGRLPAAKVLADTYRGHHPGHDFVIMVVDETTDEGFAGSDWLVIDRDEYLRMATCFDADGLVGAVLPLVLRQMLARYEVVVYLDPETQVLAPFSDITGLAASRDIVLALRSLEPVPQDGLEPSDAESFDQGFVAVGQGAKPFLDFWAERTKPCFDLVPGLFSYEPTRDPGMAVAYWNLHERQLAGDETVTAGGSPLRFMHFDGYDPRKPWLLSTHCETRPRVRISGDPRLRTLCDAYRNLLGDTEPEPYAYDRMPDGTPITERMRELFRTADEPPHPFGEDQGKAFRQWLCEPASPMERNAGLNRLVMHIWHSRPDLRIAFRRPFNDDNAGFRQWCRVHGTAEGLLPEWALPGEPAHVLPPVNEFGVNLAGYLTAELGIGEMSRVVHKALQHAGIPLVSVVEEQSIAHSSRTALDEPETAGEAKFPISILAVNGDFTQLLLDSHPAVGHERYRIGLWAWELADFPPAMHDAFALVDEIWTVSDFVRRAIAKHSPVPVKAIPVPVLDPGEVHRAAHETTQFLFAFDFNSTGGRKNPWGAVKAFRQAFPGRDDVRLVIKAINGKLHASAVERLHYVTAGDPRIDLVERYLSVDELNDLYTRSDAYVSLHRSEGFGLTVAEAMIRGMPVIATDYSGTTEFFDETVGWPIPYELTEVGPGWPPYQADGTWADPDLSEAAKAMRTIADDPVEAARRGKAAREHILRTRSMDDAGAWLRAQLENAYEVWQNRGAPARSSGLRRVARRAINHLNRGGPTP
jgi:glycosyltransferase involved in cell wall biosynthesis